jgi:outer membrane protein OmpA-like peptidoglycan-associated protein
MVRLSLCLLTLAGCSTVSPYRSVGDPSIDEPYAKAFEALKPLEDMEEATCALHDLADQASALRGIIKVDEKRFKIDESKLDELPPGLRGGLQKLNEGMGGVKAMQSTLKTVSGDLEKASQKSALSGAKIARVNLARDAVLTSGDRLQAVGTELRKLAGLAQSSTYWDRPILCKEVEDRRANRLIATTESTGGGGTARLLAQIKAYEEILEQARGSGATRCAPKSLAEAEAHAEFARVSIKLGLWFEAKNSAQKAGTLAVRTREESRPCAPKPKTPKKVIIPKKDSDNDGVLDVEDACPEIPGLRKHKGCPPPDKDGDGFLDNEDKCPNKPEDFDGYQDNDGCPEEEDADSDNDGILDRDDRCPTDPEDKDGFKDEDGCPDRDNDADGVPDTTDKCPTVAEDRDGFEDLDGCPDLDNDQDGFQDEVDKCPNDKEDRDQFEDEDGCPDYDNDKDGIKDVDDRCPMQPETINGVTDEDGCPDKKYTLIKVTKERIEISQKVRFRTGRSKVLKASFEMLDQVADAIVTNKIGKVLVEGHTDDVGAASSNMRLSQKRADAVRDYLVSKGVSADALDAIGFGEIRPIEKARTKAARAKNRRVEFKIIER